MIKIILIQLFVCFIILGITNFIIYRIREERKIPHCVEISNDGNTIIVSCEWIDPELVGSGKE